MVARSNIIHTYYQLMQSSVSQVAIDIQIKQQPITVDSKWRGKYTNLDDPAQKITAMTYIIQQANNLNLIRQQIQKKITQQIQLVYFDQDSQLVQFKNDEEILSYMATKPKFFIKYLSKEAFKKKEKERINYKVNYISKESRDDKDSKIDVSSISYATEDPEYSKSEQTIKYQIEQQILQKIEEPDEKQKNTNTNQNKLVSDMQAFLYKILKGHQPDLVHEMFHQAEPHQVPKFELTCTFCKKQQLKNRVYACEENLKVVACEECSQYLKFQLPHSPFRCFTSTQEYQKAKANQSQKAQAEFLKKFRQEKQERNERIVERVKALARLE